MKKYVVKLEASERKRLEELVREGKVAGYRIRHANILLAVDEADGGGKLMDIEASHAFRVSVRSIENLRKRLVEQGLDAALERKKQEKPRASKLFDGEKEAKLIAIACGKKPEGRLRWTMELLAGEVVRLKIVEHCSDTTIQRVLQKMN
jgi:transposase